MITMKSYTRYSTEFSKKTLCASYFSDYQFECIRFHIYASTYDELLYTRRAYVNLSKFNLSLFNAQILNCKTLPPIALPLLLSRYTHFACLSIIRKQCGESDYKISDLFIDSLARENFNPGYLKYLFYSIILFYIYIFFQYYHFDFQYNHFDHKNNIY